MTTTTMPRRRWIAEVARRPGSGILGLIASIRPENAAGFDAWVDEGPELGVVGYRRILHEISDDVSQSETFRRNVRERRGARAAVRHVLPGAAVADRAGAGAGVRGYCAGLDHCGVPDIAAGVGWIRGGGMSATWRGSRT